jgi:hypothetical protein
LIGFPNSRNKGAVSDPVSGRPRKGWVNTAFKAELTKRLPLDFASRSSGDPNAHFVMEAGKKMRLFQGGPVRDAPDFHGMSGGGVWKLHVDPRTRFVERCALVGIFTRRENERGKIALVAVRVEWAQDYRLWWRDPDNGTDTERAAT